jgi:hypothetical protein
MHTLNLAEANKIATELRAILRRCDRIAFHLDGRLRNLRMAMAMAIDIPPVAYTHTARAMAEAAALLKLLQNLPI